MPNLKKAIFSMDCFDENIEGFTYGNTWNGWACPYFTFDNAMKLTSLVPFNMWYHQEGDTFLTMSDEIDNEEFNAVIIDGQKYYAIGNCSWCWFDMTESEE